MANKSMHARHHLASLALAVLATLSTGLHAQTTIAAGDTTYRGSFSTDAKTGAVNGSGSVLWKNGNRYEGPVVNTQLTGKGSFTWANGDTYVGDMVNAQPHGQGTYTFKSGDRYTGAWRNGQKHGQGRYAFANGTVWEGEFANDQQFKEGAVAVSVAAPPTQVRAATEGTVNSTLVSPEQTVPKNSTPQTSEPQAPRANTRQEIFNQLAMLFDTAIATKTAPNWQDLDNLFAKVEQPSTYPSNDACFTAIYTLVSNVNDRIETTLYKSGVTIFSDHAVELRTPKGLLKNNKFSNLKLNAERKTYIRNPSVWSHDNISITFVPNEGCNRVFVRYLNDTRGKYMVRWHLAYSDMRYDFFSPQSFGTLLAHNFNHSVGYPDYFKTQDLGESLEDNLTFKYLGDANILLHPRAYEVQKNQLGVSIVPGRPIETRVTAGPLLEWQQKQPTLFRSQDDWPPKEKAMLASREAELARHEAEQARLAAIESEKRQKLEKARFDAAMNAKDPQTMYLAAGKYEREGDSYSALKVYEQIIGRFPSSPFAAKANDQLLANQRSDRASSELRGAQRQQGERAYQACREEVDACNTRTNYKGKCWRDCDSLR